MWFTRVTSLVSLVSRMSTWREGVNVLYMTTSHDFIELETDEDSIHEDGDDFNTNSEVNK